MALTVTEVARRTSGNRKTNTFTVTFDSSYATGGESLTAATLGLLSVETVQALPAAGYVFEYDATNSKLKAYWVDTSTDGAAMAEVVNTTDLSAVSCKVIATGY